MTQRLNAPLYPRIGVTPGEDASDSMVHAKDGVDTAATRNYGNGDPSTGGPPEAWGAAELGTEKIDGSDPDNPVGSDWLTLDDDTYGWVLKRHWKINFLVDSVPIVFSPAPNAAADVAWTDLDVSSLIDVSGVKDANSLLPKARAILVRARAKAGASETIPNDRSCYFAMRENGGSDDGHRVCPQVSDVWTPDIQFWLGLDSAQKCEFSVGVGGGTPNLNYEAEIIAVATER